LLEEQESHNVVEKNYRSSRNEVQVLVQSVQELRSAAASGKMTTEGKYMGKLGKIVLITGDNSGIGLTAKLVCVFDIFPIWK